MNIDVEVRALLFVECWKDGFDGVNPSDVRRLTEQLQDPSLFFGMLSYPTSYWVSEYRIPVQPSQGTFAHLDF